MTPSRIIQTFTGLACLATLALPMGCDPGPEPEPEIGADLDTQLTARVQEICGSCHFFPAPDLLPRSTWRPQIEQMMSMLALPSADTAAFEREVESIIGWYESRAPEKLRMERAISRAPPTPLRFERQTIRLGRGSGPGVATLSHLGSRLGVPNMALGSVHLLSWEKGPKLIGEAGHPARISAGDLDGNGLDDLVISDLGDTLPTDDPAGRVVVAVQHRADEFEVRTLVDGIGRVADARPLDLDRDGDLDLVVAAFGYRHVGGVYVLYNESTAGAIAFRRERVSEMTGALSVVPVDGLLPGTGPGFVVAFAQEHERVSLFLPRESGGFEERVLYRAPHPVWGTSHLSAADLDEDGDVDFLLSNGDTLDDGVAFKPYHGVRWLENRGTEEFRAHLLGRLYGAHAAEAGDLDGDGDLDVVASGFLPQVALPVSRERMRLDSVIWFEREGDSWIPREIESGHPRHTGVTLFDLDGDGRLDVVAAINQAWDVEPVEKGPSIEVWFNRGSR